MAILKMKRLEVIAMQKDTKEIIRLLQREGVVQIAEEGYATEVFEHVGGVSSLSIYENHLKSAYDALKALDNTAQIRTSMLDGFSGRKELSEEAFANHIKKNEQTYKMVADIEKLQKQIESDRELLTPTRQLLERYLPWENLDIPMEYTGTIQTAAFIGSLPGEYTEESLETAITAFIASNIDDKDPNSLGGEKDFSARLHSEIVSMSKDMTCIVVFCHRNDESLLRAALRSLGFVQPADPTTHPPALRIGRYRERIGKAQDDINISTQKIAAYASRRSEILFLIDYLTMKIERYHVLDHVLFSKKTVAIEGFCPEKHAQRIQTVLEKSVTAHVEIRDPGEDEEVPVLFQNNAFVSPVEDVTTSYSMPSPNDVDPNPAMAFFYYLFFGMMLSDAGYGVLMVIAILLILRYKKPEGNVRQNMLKFLYCGFSTILWGALFGSWFGNAAYVISGTFFGQVFSLNPLWFDPVQNPLQLLILSMVLGFIHILAGMGVKFYALWKNGHRADALMDVCSWWVLFLGIVLLLLPMVNPALQILGTVGPWVAIAGALCLIATQGRSSKNIFARIFGGLASLYSITGYFSDLLSYTRLMALGLVTGIIGTVVNTIGSIGGKSFLGVILFIVVFLFGHAINIGINALGAYVHGNRLQFVEFFSKFYEGGGRSFVPLSMQTRHYKIKEDK